MQIDNISFSNPFKGKVRKGYTIACGTASIIVPSAVALFEQSKKDGIDPMAVIDEYYKNEFVLRSNAVSAKMVSKYSAKDKYELLQQSDYIRFYPKAFAKIANVQRYNKSQKFNADDTVALLQEVGKNIDEHPDVFIKIISINGDDNTPKFNIKDCILLMKNVDLIINFQECFDTVVKFGLSASDFYQITSTVGPCIKEFPEIFHIAIKDFEIDDKNISVNQIIHKIQKLYSEKKQQMSYAEHNKSVETMASEVSTPNIRPSHRYMLIFDKVKTAVSTKTPLVTESGDLIPNAMRNAIATNISATESKAIHLVNIHFKDGTPVFSEKECYEILSELPRYRSVIYRAMTEVDENGNRFLSSEQAKELLKLKYSSDYNIRRDLNELTNSKKRKYSADEIIELLMTKQAEYDCKQNELASKRAITKDALIKAKELKQEALRKEQEKIDKLNKEANWIEEDKLIQKVKNVILRNIPLVTETGETIPDELLENIINNIKLHPSAVNKIINFRYENKRPVFSEKDCYEVLSELSKYSHLSDQVVMRKINGDGQPFFNSEQYKTILKTKVQGDRRFIIEKLLNNRTRQFSAEDITKIIVNANKLGNIIKHSSLFMQLAAMKLPNGDFKYTIDECIAKTIAENNIQYFVLNE